MAKKTENKAFVYTEEVTGEIVQIPVGLLHNHHQNPRKDLGDLTELADSIKAKGILQNLTVVPYWFETTGVGEDRPEKQAELGYLVVIGNRRLAAAKLAGLETLPCIISNMTKEEQLQTMLLENLQRSDLTAFEQAHGFQMMMDMGSTVSAVAEKTGFSETTIRRRLEWAKLDSDTMKRVSGRQITFGDLDKLSQIDDIAVRNKVLGSIGTNNFENKLESALQDQKDKELIAHWRTELEAIGATETSYSDLIGKYQWVSPGYFNLSDNPKRSIEKLDKNVPYFFAFSYRSIYIRKEREEEPDEDAELRQQKEDERKQRVDILEEAFKRAYQLRVTFVNQISEAAVKKCAGKVIAALVKWEWSPTMYGSYQFETFAEMIGANDLQPPRSFEQVQNETEACPYKALLAHTLAKWSDRGALDCYDYSGRYDGNTYLHRIYDLLCGIGYEMSDEEKELMDGTSELYYNEPDDDEDDFDDDFDEDEEDIFDAEDPEDAVDEAIASALDEEGAADE